MSTNKWSAALATAEVVVVVVVVGGRLRHATECLHHVNVDGECDNENEKDDDEEEEVWKALTLGNRMMMMMGW